MARNANRIRRGGGARKAAQYSLELLEKHPSCCWCGKELTRDTKRIEHLLSPGKGGGNEPDNIEISCAGCNQAKRDLSPGEFLAKFDWMLRQIRNFTCARGFCSDQRIQYMSMKNRGQPGGRLLLAYLQDYRDEVTDQFIREQRRRAWEKED